MARLFDIVGTEITLDANVIAIPALQKIWDRDKTKEKSKAILELKYITFYSDYLSPYRDLSEDIKSSVIIKDLFTGDWQPDKIILEAINKYKQLQETPLMRFLEVNLKNIDKITAYLDTVSFKGKDETDSLKMMESMTKTTEKAGNMVKSIISLKHQVQTEITEKNVRGQNEIGPYELPKTTKYVKRNQEERVDQDGGDIED